MSVVNQDVNRGYMHKLQKDKLQRKSLILTRAGAIHDAIIDTLEARLLNSSTEYLIVTKNDEYYNIYKRHYGECDLYAIAFAGKNKHLLCFEVKTMAGNESKQKALKQLDKDVDYYSKVHHTTSAIKFYVYGHGDRYFIERIRDMRFDEFNYK